MTMNRCTYSSMNQFSPFDTRSITSPSRPMVQHNLSSRNLYTESALGLFKLDRIRERKSQLFETGKDRYIERLTKYIEEGDSKSVFKDDMINLLGIAENENHLDLLEKIIISTESDQESFFKGWGTTFMRLYYRMNQLDRAYKNIKDVEKFGEFFNQRGSYKIVMTMLYNVGRYNDVLEIYELANERLHKSPGEEESHEKGLSTLAFAALAKMNNEEAFIKAEDLFAKISRESGMERGLRSASFMAYLAVNNNRPKYALNLISNTPSRQYVTLKEMKIVSLVKLERYEDILLQVREFIKNAKRGTSMLLKNSFELVLQSKDKITDEQMRNELEEVLMDMKEGGHISDLSIEDLLFKKIDSYQAPVNSSPRMYGQQRRQERTFPL